MRSSYYHLLLRCRWRRQRGRSWRRWKWRRCRGRASLAFCDCWCNIGSSKARSKGQVECIAPLALLSAMGTRRGARRGGGDGGGKGRSGTCLPSMRNTRCCKATHHLQDDGADPLQLLEGEAGRAVVVRQEGVRAFLDALHLLMTNLRAERERKRWVTRAGRVYGVGRAGERGGHEGGAGIGRAGAPHHPFAVFWSSVRMVTLNAPMGRCRSACPGWCCVAVELVDVHARAGSHYRTIATEVCSHLPLTCSSI